MLEVTFNFSKSLKGEGCYVAWAEVEARAIPDRKTPWFLVTRGESWEELNTNLRNLVRARSRELELNPNPICLRMELVQSIPAPLWVLPGSRSEGILDGLASALNPRGRPQMEKVGGTIGIRWNKKMLAVTQPERGLFPEEIALILDWALRDIREEGLPGPGLDGPSRRDLIWSILGGTEE